MLLLSEKKQTQLFKDVDGLESVSVTPIRYPARRKPRNAKLSYPKVAIAHKTSMARFWSEKRLAKGLSQSQLGHLLGYEVGQLISNVENGKCRMSIAKIGLLCEILSIPKQEIIQMLLQDYRNQLEEAFAPE